MPSLTAFWEEETGADPGDGILPDLALHGFVGES